jgi:hypothetical protein
MKHEFLIPEIVSKSYNSSSLIRKALQMRGVSLKSENTP